MRRNRTARLALWAILLAQLSALPLASWLGLDACAMGCSSMGKACCCEVRWPADEVLHVGEGETPPRFARPSEDCASTGCATLDSSRLAPQASLDERGVLIRPDAPRPAFDLLPSGQAASEKFNPATQPRSPPAFLLPA